MAEQYDVVIIGGGHNGLTVAGYLTKAGLNVCVVECQDKVGGGVISRELTLPGFKHDPASVMHGLVVANPIIHQDELGLLSKYGLKYIYPEQPFAIIFPDDRALVFHHDLDKTCESISQFSERDAEAYLRFNKAAVQMRKIAQIGMFSPPPAWGTMMSVLDASEEGREFLRVVLSSALDVAGDWFESDELKIAMARYASEIMVGPKEKGTGNAMWFVGGLHSWGNAVPVGGSGALSVALEACVKDTGGTVRVSSPVKTVKVEGGAATGIVLESGEEILASRAVISNVNVKQLFLEMVAEDRLPADFRDKVARIKPASFSGLNQALALNEAPKYKAGGDVNNTFFVEYAPSSMEEFLRAFEEFDYGIPNSTLPSIATATILDPTRAPEGKHTMYLWNYEPYNLKDGGPSRWDEIKQEVADSILQTVREVTTNMDEDNILGRWIMSPLDMSRYFPSMLEGDLGHIGPFLTQFFANRPLPGWGRYRTPIERLYMCGASTYPGQGVTCGGRAAVQIIMEDLGIDFRKVIKK
ncbi:MAG: NAD(P)/FAD-dependent oxidoreductase [Chloroflexi bacterium]|nr:NAD(P)/FAD-dependent oxidoreductase [Chloroflexota bacterium]